ncbi:NlpC/P60 family protein [Streptomyces atratus]|uniref:NlpC/P60 family protein n=1 Tax=Streptomyces atratus TaxID=1893 RepID=A0A1K1VNY0_STRAR|nr:C40 family peptidase [Streptomyces atratus]SFX26531.1 NlpC/P60 family protein [Streptomyces atratus]
MSGGVLRAACAAALATLVVTSPAAAGPVAPDPAAGGTAKAPAAPTAANRSVAQLLPELRQLYQQAEEATETYNGTAAELKKRAAQAKKLDVELVAARTALADSRDEAGRLAREQYQGRSDFSAYMRLLLSRDPEHLLDQEHVIRHAATARAATVKRLTGAEKRADELATESRKVLDRQQVLAKKQKKQRDAVRSRLKAVEKMLATLSGPQVTELSRLEQRNTEKAQGALAASGALSSTRPPSEAGGEAVRYAIAQVGKPYVWGAEGPDSFDCSGLTSQSWAKAGRVIPRTSQEQWRQLRKVPVNALRPGDLVIYFPKATHVALYIGNGLVVQAPRPGSRVKVSPVASNPLLGAVRPDPRGAPLSAYQPPVLPQGASSGSDAGYGSSSAPSASGQ